MNEPLYTEDAIARHSHSVCGELSFTWYYNQKIIRICPCMVCFNPALFFHKHPQFTLIDVEKWLSIQINKLRDQTRWLTQSTSWCVYWQGYLLYCCTMCVQFECMCACFVMIQWMIGTQTTLTELGHCGQDK